MAEAEAEATMATKAAIPHNAVLNFRVTSSAIVKLCRSMVKKHFHRSFTTAVVLTPYTVAASGVFFESVMEIFYCEIPDSQMNIGAVCAATST